MFELLKSLVNAAAFDRLFSFCRRAASRLFKRLKRAGMKAATNILDTARNVLSWLRRIGAILGRSLSRPLQPIREMFRSLVQASEDRLKRATSIPIPPYVTKHRAAAVGRSPNGYRNVH